jgi:hypothetical protein
MCASGFVAVVACCRGLRVRLGMHSGIHESSDAVFNKTSGRVMYGGLPLATAKAVGDCGQGGMVLLSQVGICVTV